MMIVTELHLLVFVLIVFLSTIPIVDAGAGRCYLCSQNKLAECAGSVQPDSPLYTTVLQYYTEPCNGQCILFRNENMSTIRGCSWTYGHMTSKSTGWHELTPGVRAFFCDTNLCNNGTYEQPEMAMSREGIADNEFILSPEQTINPQQLFIIAGNTPSVIHTAVTNTLSRQLRQCYSCTARSTGCGEFLDPRYVSNYIRPCASSCIIFKNPSDHNLITRDCSTTWPQVHAKSGLHKLLGSDAFFCQESLCNGISFDFIMGIFHNQLPAVITFPPSLTIEDITTTIPILTSTTMTITTTTPTPISAAININEDDDDIWEDPDLDFVVIEPTTTKKIPIVNNSPLLPIDDSDFIFESSTIVIQPAEHFDFIDKFPASSTIVGGMAVAEQESPFNWWDLDEVSFSPLTEPSKSPLKSTLIPLIYIEEDEWAIFNTTSISRTTRFEHLSGQEDIENINRTSEDGESNSELDMNDYFLSPTFSTTPSTGVITNNNQTFIPYYFTDYETKGQLSGFLKPLPTLAMPPFSWMLHLANQNKSERYIRQSSINKTLTTTSSTLTTKKKSKQKTVQLKPTIINDLDPFAKYCNKKQCQHGGRLNSDCLCICLPAFTGDHCETIHCNQEPAHICNFVLEHECKSEYISYLCPKFCQMNICSSNKSS